MININVDLFIIRGRFTSTKTTQSGKMTQVHVPLPKDVISTKTTQSGKMTQVPMFTSKGCDIGRGDARRVDTQKILWQINYNFHLKIFLHKKFESNKFETPLKKVCVTNRRILGSDIFSCALCLKWPNYIWRKLNGSRKILLHPES